AEKQPRLVDQALLWLAKAQAGVADPNKPQDFGNAANTLRQAAERAKQGADAGDPGARKRRGEILLELAEGVRTARQAKDAAAVIEGLLSEKALPARAEELTQRSADAWHLAGDYSRSDQVCERFAKDFPRSPLLPAVLFRGAENAYLAALAAEKNSDAEAAKGVDEAAKRYKALVEKFPEFERAAFARFGLALALYRQGDFAAAQQALQDIPAP